MSNIKTRDPVIDRRVLLDYVLKDFIKKGGRLVTPPSKPYNDPALLDSLSVGLLLSRLPHTGQPLDLAQLAQQGPLTSKMPPPGGRVGVDAIPTYTMSGSNPFLSDRGASSSNPFEDPAASNPLAAGTRQPGLARSSHSTPAAQPPAQQSVNASQDADGDQGAAAPVLDVPLLESGLSQEAIKDLSFWVFSSVVGQGQTGDAQPTSNTRAALFGSTQSQALSLVSAVRIQLEVDEVSARNMASVMRHTPPATWPASRLVSCEALTAQLVAARPDDFNALGGAGRGFKGFTRWRAGVGEVLGAAATQGPVAAWAAKGGAEGAEAARKLLARLKGGLRRTAVAGPEDMEEEEYAEGVQAVAAAYARMVQGAAPDASGEGASGWRLPWSIRARVAEALLSSLYDNLDPACLIDEAAQVRVALENQVWSALGVSPTLALALDAWVAFRQYVVTGDARLVRQLKHLINKLAQVVTASGQATTGAKPPSVVATPEDEAAADALVATQVGTWVVDHALGRLANYHTAYPPGNESAMQGMLDVLMFAARSRGDSEATLAAALADVVDEAVASQVGKLLQVRGVPITPPEPRLLAALSVATQVRDTEARVYTRLLAGAGLPHAGALVAVRLAGWVWRMLQPWLDAGPTLDTTSAEVLRNAVALDVALASDISPALSTTTASTSAGSGGNESTASNNAGGARSAATAAAEQVVGGAVRGYKRWELAGPINKALQQWVSGQASQMGTWVKRSLEEERWAVFSTREGCSQSAVELVKLVHDAADSLTSWGLPVGPGPRATLLGGTQGALTQYAAAIGAKLGDPSRLIPPPPPVTRFKKDVVANQEKVEVDMSRAAFGAAPKKAKVSSWSEMKKSMSITLSRKAGEGGFMESVPRLEQHPEFQALSSTLSNQVVTCCMKSAQYLLTNLDSLQAVITAAPASASTNTPGATRPPPAPRSAPSDCDNPFSKRKGASSGGGAAPAAPYPARGSGGSNDGGGGSSVDPQNPFSSTPEPNPFSTTSTQPPGASHSRHASRGDSGSGAANPFSDQESDPSNNPFATPASTATAARAWTGAQGVRSGRLQQGVAAGKGVGGGPGGEVDRGQQAGPLGEARAALENAREHAAAFLAIKVVYWDMRSAWLEQLYRHHVVIAPGVLPPPFSTRIEPLLDGLNQVLAEVCGAAPDELKVLFATQLLGVAAQVWARVLCDGGPCRWFTPTDAPALAADLDKLAALFEADSDGLPGPMVRSALAPCYRALAPVLVEAGPLVDALKEARARGSTVIMLPRTELGTAVAAAANVQPVPGTPNIPNPYPATALPGAVGGGYTPSMTSGSKGGIGASMRSLLGRTPSSGGALGGVTGAKVGGGAVAGERQVWLGEGMLVRAVARRPERPGSKYLKEKYKLSKRIK